MNNPKRRPISQVYIDMMKFLSTCNLLMWNSRVHRLCFEWISFKSNCLKTFLFWDASILAKLVNLKISLMCCCWRCWFDMSMSTLFWSNWTFSSVLPNPPKSHLKTLPNRSFWPLRFLFISTWIVIRDQVQYSYISRMKIGYQCWDQFDLLNAFT